MVSMLALMLPASPTPSFSCFSKAFFQSTESPSKDFQTNISRRVGIIAAMTSTLIAGEAIFGKEKIASGFDFRITVPDQTFEEAESEIKGHAQDLLQVKALIESQYWAEAQKALRQSSSYLKRDIYTIIQGKPRSERPQLRKLYSDLFNNVTKLDYAARVKDATRVWQCYENIVIALDDILSRI